MFAKSPRSMDALVLIVLLTMTGAFFIPTLLSPGIFAGSDIEAFYLPYWPYIADNLRQGHLPLWDPYIGLGMPYPYVETAAFYLPHAIFHIFPAYGTIILLVALHVVALGVFTYLFATRCMGLSYPAATIAATTVAFSGYVSSQVEHVNVVESTAWFAATTFFCAKTFMASGRLEALRYGLLSACALALVIQAQGSQVIYLSLGVFPGLALCIASPEGKWRRLFTTVPAVVVAAFLLTAVQLLSTFELASHSVRSSGLPWDEATANSVEPISLAIESLLPTFFFASLSGSGSAPFAQMIGYVGILPLIAAVFGLRYGRRDRYFAFALLALAVSLFFALGKYNPLYHIFYDYLPGLRMLRTPGRWLFLAVYAVALLAGIGIDTIWRMREKHAASIRLFCRKTAAAMAAIGLSVIAVHVVAPQPSLLFERTNPLSLSFLAFAGFAAAALALLYALGKVEKRRERVACLAIVVVFSDLLLFSHYLPFNWPSIPRSSAALAAVKQDSGLFRVAKPFYWQSGVSAAERVYDVDAYTTQNLARLERFKQVIALNSEPLLDLLNVKYVLIPPPGSGTIVTHSPPEGLATLQRSTFLPRAFAVHSARSLPDIQILDEMTKPGFDPRKIVFIEDGPELSQQPLVAGAVQIVEYLPETVRLKADLPEEGYVVLSDTYYPGWRAYVDGQESTIYHADYLLRAVRLGPGSHDVLFQFDPAIYKIGLGISLTALISLVSALVVLFRIKTKPSSRKSSS